MTDGTLGVVAGLVGSGGLNAAPHRAPRFRSRNCCAGRGPSPADEEGWFALGVGVGVVMFATLPGRISSSRHTTGALLVVIVVGFIAVRSAQLLTSAANSSDLVALGAETLILTVALSLLRAHLYGIGRLVSSLSQPAQELGYARILRFDEAAVVIESELARNRRRNEPLLLIELEGRTDPDTGDFSVPDYVGRALSATSRACISTRGWARCSPSMHAVPT